MIVRPDDIDMNNHVHNSKYLDYVLFARYDQMRRCYKMPMDEFVQRGWAWVVKTCFIEFKRPLNNAERIVVRTWLDSFERSDVKVCFQILKKENGKIAAEGFLVNTMISAASRRAQSIPREIIEHYTQYTE